MNIIIGLLVLAACLYPAINNYIKNRRAKRRRIHESAPIFGNYYLNSRALFLHRFGNIPSVTLVSEINVKQAFAHLQEKYGHLVADVYQASDFNRHEGVQKFSETFMVLKQELIVELASSYAEVLYTAPHQEFAGELVKELGAFGIDGKKEAFEISIITSGHRGLELKRLEIKPTRLDIDLYYNDDFAEVDNVIRSRLLQESDKGIILLHGLPGTGKTTYLRHLIGTVRKKVLFVSPSVAANLMNPEFIDLLIDNPNSILVIEDAEQIIRDRKADSFSSVSNLLNLSDGLLSDCLNVQLICTFNSSLTLVDEALLRKGRLIARYEFGKLSVAKAQRLSLHTGSTDRITRPMSLAEVLNGEEKEYNRGTAESPIGFRLVTAEA